MLLSKEAAWKVDVEEKFVPIKDKQNYTLRRNWFHNRNCCTFSTYLLDKYPPDRPYNMLTIGVFEGAQEIWMCQNLLSHPDSKLICIDPWMQTNKLSQEFMDQCHDNAHANLSEWIQEGKVALNRGFSGSVMCEAITSEGAELCGVPVGEFDFIIIDGDHTRPAVLADALNAHALLKPGGWMLFDDVRNRISKKDHVWDGLIEFLQLMKDRVNLVWEHRYCSCVEKVS